MNSIDKIITSKKQNGQLASMSIEELNLLLVKSEAALKQFEWVLKMPGQNAGCRRRHGARLLAAHQALVDEYNRRNGSSTP